MRKVRLSVLPPRRRAPSAAVPLPRGSPLRASRHAPEIHRRPKWRRCTTHGPTSREPRDRTSHRVVLAREALPGFSFRPLGHRSARRRRNRVPDGQPRPDVADAPPVASPEHSTGRSRRPACFNALATRCALGLGMLDQTAISSSGVTGLRLHIATRCDRLPLPQPGPVPIRCAPVF